ncbi:MAG: hypothetical protein UY72_C0003G0012 [Candidatus Uhrbacteria bacterium GW2011_GWD2_52_7]|uniref:Uncharacterized protein n=1 Tax=Candidatus Uhrbacteria bacterium GW2011_GWD2_52_7 TaxID=1618989 RepID=A0A0G1XHS0_9BACT|nr:MAG: hypothetical protein UY72_C0003G0012 [Candidatus Uhrbacteria bacterium GW2011_GWD2_52_7]
MRNGSADHWDRRPEVSLQGSFDASGRTALTLLSRIPQASHLGYSQSSRDSRPFGRLPRRCHALFVPVSFLGLMLPDL